MRKHKLTYLLLFSGIFILVCSPLLGLALARQYREANGEYGTGKITAYVQQNSNSRGNAAFSRQDLTQLQRYYGGERDLAYAAEDVTSVSWQSNVSQADVLGVSASYNRFHDLKLKYGSFFTDANQNQPVAVIDERLAQTLFNSDQVMGLAIEVYGRRFRIIGVTATDRTIFHSMSDDGRGLVFLPAEEMLDVNSKAQISVLEVTTPYAGTGGRNINDFTGMLAGLVKNPAGYQITDQNISEVLVREKALVGVFVAGVLVIMLLFHHINTKVQDFYQFVKRQLQNDYFSGIVKTHWRQFAGLAALIGAGAVLALLVWKSIRFNLYVPPQFIPSDLLDTAFYTNLWHTYIQGRIAQAGYIPLMESQANMIRTLANWNLGVNLIFGFPIFFLGYYQLRLSGANPLQFQLYSSLAVIVSLVLSEILMVVLKLPLAVHFPSIAVVFLLVFLTGLQMLPLFPVQDIPLEQIKSS